ncbi:hypothetical protein P8452_05941 [Trifolium repens]|nr:hypothetical protein P8452_05941 [Trifolium repens]
MVVSNNSEFDSLVQQYVIGGGAPAVSFDISDNGREMDKVYRAIGCSWRVVMLARPDYSNAKTDEIMVNMHIFRINNGIIDHDDAPDWA